MTDPFNPSTNLAAPWRSFVVIDTETNGLDEGPYATPDPRVISLAAVRFDEGVLTQRFSSLVRTSVPIPEGATKINGITDSMCEIAPPFVDVWRGLLVAFDWSSVGLVLAYNGEFDFRFLNRDVKRARLEGHDLPKAPREIAPPWGDVLVWMRNNRIDRTPYGKGNHKLTTVCARWNVELLNAHSAEADAIATGNLWLAIAPKVISCVQSSDIASVLRVQEALATKQQRGYERWAVRQPKVTDSDGSVLHQKAGAA